MRKLTKAQLQTLAKLADGDGVLVNADECAPSWWIEGGGSVNPRSAYNLSRTPYLKYFRHEGGQPGVDFFSITEAGRKALEESNG